MTFLPEPPIAEEFSQKVRTAARDREAAAGARNNSQRPLPALDCRELPIARSRSGATELYVEGEAGGRQAGARPAYHAICDRGGITSKSARDQFLKNNDIQSMITAIGAALANRRGWRWQDEGRFDITVAVRTHYHDDADVDGSHIRTCSSRFSPANDRMVEPENLHAQPPLYQIKRKNRGIRGRRCPAEQNPISLGARIAAKSGR